MKSLQRHLLVAGLALLLLAACTAPVKPMPPAPPRRSCPRPHPGSHWSWAVALRAGSLTSVRSRRWRRKASFPTSLSAPAPAPWSGRCMPQATAVRVAEAGNTDGRGPGQRLVAAGSRRHPRRGLAEFHQSRDRPAPVGKAPAPVRRGGHRLQSGEAMVFRTGNTGMAVRASSSVPGVFQPVKINGREYVDGGLVSPVPVKAARENGRRFCHCRGYLQPAAIRQHLQHD